MIDDDSEVIRVAAVVLRNLAGDVLTVRKAGTTRFMLPGGKPEAGEQLAQTAVRECKEELKVELDGAKLRSVGVFRAAAANEDGKQVEATVFEHPAVDVDAPAGEIEQVRWLDITASTLPTDLAPMLSGHVIPALLDEVDQSLRRVTVFTGSSMGTEPAHRQAAVGLGTQLARDGIALVYGGARVGLMGQIADAVLRAGGDVIGVLPRGLMTGEIPHANLPTLEVVADMHERKMRMARLGDAFVALPGGAGTLEEFFEAWTWLQLGLHRKPVALLNVNGFWDPLLAMLDHMVDHGFVSNDARDSLIVSSAPADLTHQLSSWRPPVTRWTS